MHGPVIAMICQALRLSGVVILLQEKPLYCIGTARNIKETKLRDITKSAKAYLYN